MTADEIKQYLAELNDELRLMDIKGEVSPFGGAVMVSVRFRLRNIFVLDNFLFRV